MLYYNYHIVIPATSLSVHGPTLRR